MNSMIDWNDKLLVVSDSGRECEAVVKPGSVEGNRRIFWETTTSAYSHSFFDNGMPHPGISCWEVRNVAPKEVEWGPEIKVEGKRPEWLREDAVWQWRIKNDPQFEDGIEPSKYVDARTFGLIDAIRLPANHPHYTKPATPTRTALEQRMEDLVRAIAVVRKGHDTHPGKWFGIETELGDEARAILAELEPVDIDLIEARKMTATPPSDYEHVNDKIRRGHWLNGVYDKDPMIQVALSAIKRGRALERGESPVTNEGAGR